MSIPRTINRKPSSSAAAAAEGGGKDNESNMSNVTQPRSNSPTLGRPRGNSPSRTGSSSSESHVRGVSPSPEKRFSEAPSTKTKVMAVKGRSASGEKNKLKVLDSDRYALYKRIINAAGTGGKKPLYVALAVAIQAANILRVDVPSINKLIETIITNLAKDKKIDTAGDIYNVENFYAVIKDYTGSSNEKIDGVLLDMIHTALSGSNNAFYPVVYDSSTGDFMYNSKSIGKHRNAIIRHIAEIFGKAKSIRESDTLTYKLGGVAEEFIRELLANPERYIEHEGVTDDTPDPRDSANMTIKRGFVSANKGKIALLRKWYDDARKSKTPLPMPYGLANALFKMYYRYYMTEQGIKSVEKSTSGSKRESPKFFVPKGVWSVNAQQEYNNEKNHKPDSYITTNSNSVVFKLANFNVLLKHFFGGEGSVGKSESVETILSLVLGRYMK